MGFDRVNYLKMSIIFLFFSLFICSCNPSEKNEQADNTISDSNIHQTISQNTNINHAESETTNILEIRNELGYYMDGDYIICEEDYIAYLTSNGMVYIQPMNEAGRVIEELGTAVSIYGDGNEIVALNNDGDMVIYSVRDNTIATEPKDINEDYSGFELGGTMLAQTYHIKKSLLDLKNVEYITMSYPSWYFAILQDGTKVLEGLEDTADITLADIIKVSSNDSDMIGLKSDGTLFYDLYAKKLNEINKIKQWTDLIDIEYGSYAFGLKEDGTVVSSWSIKECAVEDWKDIKLVSASYNTTVGLRKDGKVQVAFDIDYGQKEAEEWEDIVAIKASTYYVAGIKTDGSLLVTSSTDQRFQNIDLSDAPTAYVPQWEED